MRCCRAETSQELAKDLEQLSAAGNASRLLMAGQLRSLLESKTTNTGLQAEVSRLQGIDVSGRQGAGTDGESRRAVGEVSADVARTSPLHVLRSTIMLVAHVCGPHHRVVLPHHRHHPSWDVHHVQQMCLGRERHPQVPPVTQPGTCAVDPTSEWTHHRRDAGCPGLKHPKPRSKRK